MSKQVNYNENLVAGAAIRDDKGRRISKLFEASHPKMTVGYAKNLIMPDTPTEQKFNFRQAGGGVIEDGVAVIDKVKGNSVVWNQLMKFGASTKTDNGITYEIKEDGRVHVYGTATARSTVTYYNSIGAVISGHKYIVVSANNIINGEANGLIASIETQGGIATCNQSHTTPVWFFRVYNGVTIDVTFRPQLVDLTQMFGAGNEPTTYEEFLSRKPKVADEYAYNEGTIVNNKVEKVVTTGVNLWDEQWELGSLNAQGLPAETTASIRSKEFNRCLPNCEICFSCQSAAAKLIYWYDVNKAFISRYEIPNSASIYGVTTSPANAYFFKVRNDKSTYNHDICINLSDPAINGQYFPYEKHELDLSWVKDIKDAEGVKLFEDGIKSTGTAFDEVGKNKAVKRLGVKVLDGSDMYGAILHSTYGSSTRFNLESFKAKNNSMTTNSYGFDNRGIGVANAESIAFHGGSGYLLLQIATSKASSVDELRTYLASHPLTIIYELAEPIEVEYDEKNLTYPVIAGGTEEAIAIEPSTAFRADIGYGIDAVKTILDLKARVEALEGK